MKKTLCIVIGLIVGLTLIAQESTSEEYGFKCYAAHMLAPSRGLTPGYSTDSLIVSVTKVSTGKVVYEIKCKEGPVFYFTGNFSQTTADGYHVYEGIGKTNDAVGDIIVLAGSSLENFAKGQGSKDRMLFFKKDQIKFLYKNEWGQRCVIDVYPSLVCFN